METGINSINVKFFAGKGKPNSITQPSPNIQYTNYLSKITPLDKLQTHNFS